jgi:hypothetical protein
MMLRRHVLSARVAGYQALACLGGRVPTTVCAAGAGAAIASVASSSVATCGGGGGAGRGCGGASAPDPRTGLTPRLPQLHREQCTTEQAQIYDSVTASASACRPAAPAKHRQPGWPGVWCGVLEGAGWLAHTRDDCAWLAARCLVARKFADFSNGLPGPWNAMLYSTRIGSLMEKMGDECRNSETYKRHAGTSGVGWLSKPPFPRLAQSVCRLSADSVVRPVHWCALSTAGWVHCVSSGAKSRFIDAPCQLFASHGASTCVYRGAGLIEIGICMVGVEWLSQFEVHAHYPMARKAGVSEAMIEALKARLPVEQLPPPPPPPPASGGSGGITDAGPKRALPARAKCE